MRHGNGGDGEDTRKDEERYKKCPRRDILGEEVRGLFNAPVCDAGVDGRSAALL